MSWRAPRLALLFGVLAVSALVLAACGDGAASPASSPSPPGSGAGGKPAGAAKSVFPDGDIDEDLRPWITRATDDLASRLGIATGEITAVSAVLVEWPDTSLGCPQPGMRYAQVMTDGAVIELRTAGRVYRYHAGGDRTPFLCTSPLARIPRRP